MSKTITICGVAFELRPFTNKEADLWADIMDKRDLEGNQKRALKLQAEVHNLQNKRLELHVKGIEVLETKLHKLYEADEWDLDAIAVVQEKILEQNEKLAQLRNEDADRQADALEAWAEKLEEVRQVAQEGRLEMAHRIAEDGRSFDEWLEAAGEDDYKAAEEWLRVAYSPFHQRRHRARRAGGGTSSKSRR